MHREEYELSTREQALYRNNLNKAQKLASLPSPPLPQPDYISQNAVRTARDRESFPDASGASGQDNYGDFQTLYVAGEPPDWFSRHGTGLFPGPNSAPAQRPAPTASRILRGGNAVPSVWFQGR